MPDKLTYLYADTFKADPETGYFEGIVNTGKKDVQGQIVDPDWLKKELPPWIAEWANIRHQHDPMKPIGVADEADLTFSKGPKLSGRVVDEQGKKNLAAGLYKGLSVGIKSPVIVKDAQAPNGRIVGGKLIEISLVDRPADDGAKLLLYKSVGADGWKDCQTGVTLSPRESDLADDAPPGSPLAALKAAQPTLTKCDLDGCDCDCAMGAPDPDCDCECAFCAAARASVDKTASPDATKREFSDKERKRLADSGAAMADGSYPIVNASDLENAVRAYGRSPDEATKRHIIKRAFALGRTDLLPADWPGSTKKETKTVEQETTPVVADAEKAKMPKSEPNHAHPHKGAHNHNHTHEMFGRMVTHTHAHLHDDDDMHEHTHLDGKDARILSPEDRESAMRMYAAEADAHKAATFASGGVIQIAENADPKELGRKLVAELNKAVKGQVRAPKATQADTSKGAPDWNIEKPEPGVISRPGRIEGELPESNDFADAIRRIERLANQTDDRDGDVDTPANMKDDAMQKREASDFQGDNPKPSLIDPGKIELLFAASIEKAVQGLETRLTKRLDARLAAQDSQYLTKAAAAENLTTAADVAKMASDLAKGLSVLADNAEASGKELATVKAAIAETQADLEKVKEMAQPPKGVVAVTKGIGIETDRYLSAHDGKEFNEVSAFIEKALAGDDNDRRGVAEQVLKAIYAKNK